MENAHDVYTFAEPYAGTYLREEIQQEALFIALPAAQHHIAQER